MADHRITCVNKEASHGHIQSVGISDGNRYSVEQVYSLIDQHHSFHTGTTGDGDYARVSKSDCVTCLRPTLRSHPDGKPENNLDNISSC